MASPPFIQVSKLSDIPGQCINFLLAYVLSPNNIKKIKFRPKEKKEEVKNTDFGRNGYIFCRYALTFWSKILIQYNVAYVQTQGWVGYPARLILRVSISSTAVSVYIYIGKRWSIYNLFVHQILLLFNFYSFSSFSLSVWLSFSLSFSPFLLSFLFVFSYGQSIFFVLEIILFLRCPVGKVRSRTMVRR